MVESIDTKIAAQARKNRRCDLFNTSNAEHSLP
jgi:hypothetical protein